METPGKVPGRPSSAVPEQGPVEPPARGSKGRRGWGVVGAGADSSPPSALSLVRRRRAGVGHGPVGASDPAARGRGLGPYLGRAFIYLFGRRRGPHTTRVDSGWTLSGALPTVTVARPLQVSLRRRSCGDQHILFVRLPFGVSGFWSHLI